MWRWCFTSSAGTSDSERRARDRPPSKRGEDQALDDVEDLPAVVAALVAHVGGRRRDDDCTQLAKHDDVLPAVAPGETTLAAGELARPPAVAVGLIGIEARSSQAGARGVHPRCRDD